MLLPLRPIYLACLITKCVMKAIQVITPSMGSKSSIFTWIEDIEQSIWLTLCPQCVIQEGIAMLAHEMVFTEGEAGQWPVEHVYRPFQKDVDDTVLLNYVEASQMLGSVWGNKLSRA